MIIKQADYVVNKNLMNESMVKYYAKRLGVPYAKPEPVKDDELIGLICLDNEEKVIGRLNGKINYTNFSCQIEVLFVEPETRGSGTGRRLLQEFEEIASKKGALMSFVETTSSSAPEFYEKQGYRLTGTIADFPVEKETFYLFHKRLKEKALTDFENAVETE